MEKILIGWALSSTLTSLWLGYLLYKKDTTNNIIGKFKPKSKGNKGSEIENHLTPTFESKQPKKGLLKRIFTKKQKK